MRLHSVSPASWAVKMPPWSNRKTGSTSAVGTAQPRRNVPPRFTAPAAAFVLVLFDDELPPQAASSVPIDKAESPATVARTISWRRVNRPERPSSTRCYSSSPIPPSPERLHEFVRRYIRSRCGCNQPQAGGQPACGQASDGGRGEPLCRFESAHPRGRAPGLRRFAERFERVHARQAVERAALDLLCLLRTHAQLATHLGAGALLALGAEAQRNDLALVLRQGLEGLGHLLADDAAVDLLLRRLVVGGAKVAERGGVGVVAQLHVEAGRRVVDRPDLLHLEDIHVGDRCYLVQLGLTLELHRQLVADAPDLARLRGHVGRQADGAGGVVEAALDRLTGPQGGVRREAEPLAPVELLRCADEPEHALLNEVVQGQPMALVPPGDGDDEAQVGIDEPVLGKEVAALDALGELDLLCGLQQLVLVRPLKELLERVGVDVALMIFKDLVLRLGLGQDPPDEIPICTVGIIPSFGCTRNLWDGAGLATRHRIVRNLKRGKPAGRRRTAGDTNRVSNIRSFCPAVTQSATMELCCWPNSSQHRAPSAPPPRAARRWI